MYEGMKNKISIPVISALKITKLFRQSRGFLATLIDKENKETRIEDIAVIREYPNVFPEDLPGLPSDRKVGFSIDRLPETGPISKAPYRMGPAEIKELKEQLQESLNLRIFDRVYHPRVHLCYL